MQSRSDFRTLQRCMLPPFPKTSHLSVSTSFQPLLLLLLFTLDSRLSLDCVCSERPLCRAAARVILRGLLCQSQEVRGARRGRGPAIDWAGAGLRPGAAPSPVTVSSLSLTVCSQLDSFCPRVKAFSRRTLRCQLGRAFCAAQEMASVP